METVIVSKTAFAIVLLFLSITLRLHPAQAERQLGWLDAAYSPSCDYAMECDAECTNECHDANDIYSTLCTCHMSGGNGCIDLHEQLAEALEAFFICVNIDG